MVLVSLVFLRTAREKGYPVTQFVVFPLAIGGGLMLACFLVGVIAGWIGSTAEFALRLSAVADVMALIVFFAVIAIAWKRIKSLPVAK